MVPEKPLARVEDSGIGQRRVSACIEASEELEMSSLFEEVSIMEVSTIRTYRILMMRSKRAHLRINGMALNSS